MKRWYYFAAIVIAIFIIGFFLTSDQTAKVQGVRQISLGTGSGSAELSVPYGVATSAQVVGNTVEVTSEIGKVVAGGIVVMDTAAPAQWAIHLPDDSDWEISGDTNWVDVLAEGQERTFTTTVTPTSRSVIIVEIEGRITPEELNIGDNFCCGFSEAFHILYDGSIILLARSEGEICPEGTYLDRKNVLCTSPPNCPENYRYNNVTNTCDALTLTAQE